MAVSSPERFGEFVRSRRNALGISVRTLAKELGVSAGYVSAFEAGSQAPPTIDRLEKLSAVLCVDGDALIGLADRWSDLVVRETATRPAMLSLFRAARTLTDEQVQQLTDRALELSSR
ncbi:MAG: helix-turn-helix domain-containing protein [Fimbriimonadaceae bacterium]|nr:helix-turn-helix domain-containing protein [Fimbriimonadaceae bacterium]NUM38592.1 helix-turn-helix transcriptional regulator [Armatimonadota bacterium]